MTTGSIKPRRTKGTTKVRAPHLEHDGSYAISLYIGPKDSNTFSRKAVTESRGNSSSWETSAEAYVLLR